METIDCILIFALFIITFIIRIWNISIPDCVVFDEFHFGQFINDYTNHNFFFDIHPPLGKLIYYFLAKLICYDNSLSFNNVNAQYSNEVFVFFRIIPAILSSLIPGFIYSILRNSLISVNSSFSSSLLISFEISIISQCRFILIEGIQHFFICAHLLILSSSKNIAFIGFSLGLAISVKMTSFSLIPFTLLYVIVLNLQNNQISYSFFLKSIRQSLIIILIALLIFILFTMIHLNLLPNSTNDAIEFLPTELYNEIFSVNANKFILLIKNSIKLNLLMNKINQKNKQIHPYSSSPLNWPLLTGIWVGMWSDETNNRQINCMGNFFVYFFGFFGLIFRVFQLISKCLNDRKSLKINVASLSFLGWIFSYFPFFLVKRTVFLYHYQISLVFSILNFGFVSSNFSFIGGICLLLTIFGFIYWKPLLYGTFLCDDELNKIIWNRRWRYGDIHHQKLIEAFFDDFQF